MKSFADRMKGKTTSCDVCTEPVGYFESWLSDPNQHGIRQEGHGTCLLSAGLNCTSQCGERLESDEVLCKTEKSDPKIERSKKDL